MTALSPVQRPSTLHGDDLEAPRMVSGHTTRRPKSRMPSLAAGDFGALRPIVRGLSSVNLHDL